MVQFFWPTLCICSKEYLEKLDNFLGEKNNSAARHISAAKQPILWLGTKFRGARKAVVPSDLSSALNHCWWCVVARDGHSGVEDTDTAGRDHSQCSHVVNASSHLLSQPADAATAANVDDSQQSARPVSDSGAYCKHRDATRSAPETDRDVTVKKDDVEAASLETHGGHHHATRSLILILALSLHRIFEGMSIGLQQSVTNVISLFGAVMCHEMVIGFSLGLQFVRAGFALRRLVITTFVCSCIMPLGVLIGLVMTEVESSSGNIDIANGLLQAIAMGTFIYVTFFEILQEEVDSEDTSLGKIVFIALGFALMALLNLIPEGEFVTKSHVYLNTSTPVPPVNATLKA